MNKLDFNICNVYEICYCIEISQVYAHARHNVLLGDMGPELHPIKMERRMAALEE